MLTTALPVLPYFTIPIPFAALGGHEGVRSGHPADTESHGSAWPV